jgi:hypothetical protein
LSCGVFTLAIPGTQAGAAVKKAKEPLQDGYLDVRISTPRGRILLSDEFDQLEE